MTKRMEGNSSFGSLWETITSLNHLDKKFRQAIEDTEDKSEDFYFRNAVRYGYEKLNDY